MNRWVLIDYDFRDKLPKVDCVIWLTRVCFTGERWVQKVDFYADEQDIEYDGTIALMVADINVMPKSFNDRHTTVIQAERLLMEK